MWQLDAVGLRGDEAVYAGQAALLAGTPGMDRWFVLASRGNSNFLAFQWITSLFYRIFGVSDFTPRMISAVLSTLTVVVVYVISRLLYGRVAGVFAGLTLAISSYAVGLGRLALLDSTLAFLVALSMLCLVTWHHSGRTAWLVAFGGSAAFAIQA